MLQVRSSRTPTLMQLVLALQQFWQVVQAKVKRLVVSPNRSRRRDESMSVVHRSCYSDARRWTVSARLHVGARKAGGEMARETSV